MTREEAERLVAKGEARWEGDELVYNRAPSPLTRDRLPIPGEPEPTPVRVSWPGWRRLGPGEWIRVPT